jgi:hypothetical membrane protein
VKDFGVSGPTTPHRLAGPWLWLSTIQYFVVQVVAALAWREVPYDWRLNAISDLGARSCGVFDDRMVCSPLHTVMNVSLILLGVAMAAGAVLLWGQLRRDRVAFSMIAVAGIGAIIVGFFPEDSVFWIHIAGADLAFLVGNVALIVFAFTLNAPRWLTWYSVVSGVVSLIAMVLFLTHNRFFFDLGGMERMTAYPQTIWLIVFAAYLLTRRRGLDGRKEAMASTVGRYG